MSLMPVEQAQARLLALAPRLPPQTLPIGQCAGRWLANDVVALRDQPWADLSAMDGYAIRAAQWPGPWRVIGESAAGTGIPPELAAGDACRIFTGAPLPRGADAIMIQEDARRDGDQVVGTRDAPVPGRHIRRAGSDFAADTVLLAPGSRLDPAQLALAALAGQGQLSVGHRPSVALISTGNELVPPGVPVPPGGLPSSNAVMLSAMLASLPCDITDVGIVPDDMDAMTAAFNAARHADVIVSTGGASVGDHDLVRPAFQAVGGSLDFWKVKLRPGKPLIAGSLDRSLFLGLPGNPVSAFVTAWLFLLPLVRHIAGDASPFPQPERATLADSLPGAGDRDEYLRAFRKNDRIVAVTSQDSAATRALADADCLILRAAGSPPAKPGDEVPIFPLAW
ncbi:gephyrin-like molybdotransferase Glp [Sphingobium sp. AN641]|uniref:molybdopterin molybdotransferase MoeA n=1 Tax=Sphingobium sp. AN641 TaxID=3133443 RepID=UPI0030BBCC43